MIFILETTSSKPINEEQLQRGRKTVVCKYCPPPPSFPLPYPYPCSSPTPSHPTPLAPYSFPTNATP